MRLTFSIIHQIAELLMWFFHVHGKCANCGQVGYWAPFGGWLSTNVFGDNRRIRRWLCKWCGYYVDEHGLKFDRALIHPKCKTWVLPTDLTEKELKEATTPKQIFEKAMVKFYEKNK